MKELLLFKRIDFWAQLAALFIPIGLSLTFSPFSVFYIYFTLGACQVLSFLLNVWILPSDYKRNGRFLYGWVLLCIIIISALVGSIVMTDNAKGLGDLIMLYLCGMLLAGIVMGIWYMVITVHEMTFLEKLVKRHELIK